MKHLFIGLATGCVSCLSLNAYAANPVNGPYAGGLFGVSYQFKNTANTTTPFTHQPTKSTIGYDTLIDAGGQLGYRFCKNYRIEAELLYNNNPYSYLNLGNITLHNHSQNNIGYTIKGSSTEGIAFGNLFFDYLGGGENSVVPYLGAGIGYAYVYNVIRFYENGVYIENSRATTTKTIPAAQGILGLSTFLDDFMSFAVDLRYTATQSSKYTTVSGQQFDTRLKFASVNFLFNGAFDFA
jgi:hypothetical protein